MLAPTWLVALSSRMARRIDLPRRLDDVVAVFERGGRPDRFVCSPIVVRHTFLIGVFRGAFFAFPKGSQTAIQISDGVDEIRMFEDVVGFESIGGTEDAEPEFRSLQEKSGRRHMGLEHLLELGLRLSGGTQKNRNLRIIHGHVQAVVEFRKLLP